jgi:hypothetical protein
VSGLNSLVRCRPLRGQPDHLLGVLGLAQRVEVRELARPVKERQGVINVAVHPHFAAKVVVAVLVGRNLQSQTGLGIDIQLDPKVPCQMLKLSTNRQE